MIEEDDLVEEAEERCPINRCPIGLPQRRCRCLAYREREPGRLQLRVVMSTCDGICDAIVEECEDRVYVRVVLCYDDSVEPTADQYANCPTHVYLEKPLGERKVIDAETDRVLPLFVPNWG
jgi:hypothetical protein